MQIVEVAQRVVPVTYQGLDKFSRKDLEDYAKSIGVPCGKTKHHTINRLLNSGKATFLATLGN